MSRRADPLTGTTEVGTVVIREDITQGQRLERVVVIGVTDGREEVVAEADSVGYRRIVRFPRALPTRSGSGSKHPAAFRRTYGRGDRCWRCAVSELIP